MARIVALAGIVVLLAAFARPQDADLKRTVADAEGAKKTGRKLSKDARERIEKALGEKLEADLPAIWEARAMVPSVDGTAKSRVLFTSATVPGTKGGLRVGVAIVPDESVIAAVRILENKADGAATAHAFVQQLEGFAYAPSLRKPLATLAAARQKAKDGKDDAARELAALLSLTEKMHALGAEWETFYEQLNREESAAVESAQRIRQSLAQTAGAGPALRKFLQPGQIERYELGMKGAVADLDKIIGFLKAKKFAEAGNKAHELGNDRCNRCHASFRTKFQERRGALDVGNGYFQVGHDVAPVAGTPPETLQALATAIRKAVLILAESQ